MLIFVITSTQILAYRRALPFFFDFKLLSEQNLYHIPHTAL